MPSYLRNFQNLKNIPPSNFCRNLGEFPNAWESGEFHKFLRKSEKISQMPRYLENFPNTQFSVKEIPQMPGNLGNSQVPQILREFEGSFFFKYKKFLKCLAIWKIFQISRGLRNSHR